MAALTKTAHYEVQVFGKKGDVLQGPFIFTTGGITENDKGMVGVIIGNVAWVADIVFLRVRDDKSLYEKKMYKEIKEAVGVELDFKALVKAHGPDTRENNAKIARSFLSDGQKAYFVEKV